MSQTVYGLLRDCGDGSSVINWYRDASEVRRLLDNDDENAYYANEGSPSETLIFPDDLDLEKCGFTFWV